jgi:hypothetical protein
MIKKFASLLLFSLAMLSAFFASAQTDIEMSDGLRANGKIYVVVLVLAVVLAGMFVFLMMIDRRLRRIEKNQGKS